MGKLEMKIKERDGFVFIFGGITLIISLIANAVAVVALMKAVEVSNQCQLCSNGQSSMIVQQQTNTTNDTETSTQSRQAILLQNKILRFFDAIDECSINVDDCDVNADCVDTVGSFTCTCIDGFAGDGVNCTDVDECFYELHNCHRNGVCSNSPGNFSCSCKNGFLGDGVNTCADIDECANSRTCHHLATCRNMIGSYSCTCNPGYSGDGLICTDLDECATNIDTCDPYADCTNNDGGFHCDCRTGFSGNGTSCTDIDECSTNNRTCHSLATCVNTIGFYNCTCDTGYSGDGLICTDLDECSTNIDNCDTNADCTNSVGSFDCACRTGFNGNGTSCTDIDECLLNTAGCHVNAICNNVGGSFSCACADGYAGDGYACADINECSLNTDNCDGNAVCSNSLGSFVCTCIDGYFGDGVRCSDDVVEFNFPSVAQTTNYIKYRPSLPSLSEATLCLWFYSTKGSFESAALAAYNVTNEYNEMVLGPLYGQFALNAGFSIMMFPWTVESNRWTHLCVSFKDRATSSLYVDGDHQQTVGYTGPSIPGGGTLIFGHDRIEFQGLLLPDIAFHGSMQSVMMWPRQLSDYEISEIARTCVAPTDTVVHLALSNVDIFGDVTTSSAECKTI